MVRGENRKITHHFESPYKRDCYSGRSQSLVSGPHKNRRIAVCEFTLHHVLVSLANLVEIANFPHTWIDPSGADKLIISDGLFSVGAVRSLQTLLTHPVIAQVN